MDHLGLEVTRTAMADDAEPPVDDHDHDRKDNTVPYVWSVVWLPLIDLL